MVPIKFEGAAITTVVGEPLGTFDKDDLIVRHFSAKQPELVEMLAGVNIKIEEIIILQ